MLLRDRVKPRNKVATDIKRRLYLNTDSYNFIYLDISLSVLKYYSLFHKKKIVHKQNNVNIGTHCV